MEERVGETGIARAVRRFFALHPEVEPGRSILAFSGGRDSSLLASILVELGMAPALAVYIDHRLRPDAELEAERALVLESCTRLGLDLEIVQMEKGAVDALARGAGIGVEAAARRLRYSALASQARARGLSAIITAHHQDDQLETLILRLLRSSGSRGLAGMRPLRSLEPGLVLARPLLEVPSREIDMLAARIGLEYSRDSSNASGDYRRNRIRMRLLPILDADFSGWREGALASMGRLGEEAEFLEEIYAEKMGEGRETFLSASPFLRSELLSRAFSSSGSARDPSRKAMRQAADSLARGAARAELFDRVLSLGPEGLSAAPALDSPPEYGYFFRIDVPGSYRAGSMRLEAEWVCGERPETESHADLDSAAFEFPLVLRSRMPGDRIGNPGSSLAVDEILKAWGLGVVDRAMVPLAEDARGIVAILPAAIPGMEERKPRYRHFSGMLSGKALRIRIKGVRSFDVR